MSETGPRSGRPLRRSKHSARARVATCLTSGARLWAGTGGRGLIEWYLGTRRRATVTGFTDYVWTPTTVHSSLTSAARLADADEFDASGAVGVVNFAPNPACEVRFSYAVRMLRGRGAPVESPMPGGPCRRALASSATRSGASRAARGRRPL